MKWIYIALIIGIILIAAISYIDIYIANTVTSYPYPIDRYMEDPLYCEQDSDCTYQTSCECKCPVPVNTYNLKIYRCAPCPPTVIRDLYCSNTMPKCISNQCNLVSLFEQ